MNITHNKRACRAIAVILTVLCCIMTLNLSASAAAEQKIEFKVNGSEVQVFLSFPQAAAEGISTMQISLSVPINTYFAAVEFVPAVGLHSEIIESRYKNNTGILNIYFAGTKPIFSASAPLNIGTVRIIGNSGQVSAAVEVVEGSIKFVRGGEVITPVGEISYPSPVTITAGGTSVSTQPPASGSSTTAAEPPAAVTDTAVPTATEKPPVTSDDVSVSQPAVIAPNPKPADSAALSAAVTRAKSYKRLDYTPSSYDALAQALEKAESLLSNPNANQYELDEALLVLENAMGMLVLETNVPTGGEDRRENNANVTTAESNENGGNNNAHDETSAAETSGDAASGVEGQEPDGSSDKQQDSDNSLTVLIIVLIVVGIAVAGVAAAAVIAANKKKSAKGKHGKG